MKDEFRQVVRLGPPGELRAYVVYEHQLDLLEQGQPVALMLNFALFFLGIAATGLGTLAALPTGQDRTYYTFLIISTISLIAGVVLLALWLAMRRPIANLVAEIKAQMPPNPAVAQIPTRGSAILGAGPLHTSPDE